MYRKCVRLVVFFTILAMLLPTSSTVLAQQKMDSINADRVKQMLRDAYEDVKKNYYDPKFHGLDWDARYHEYQEKMKSATSLGQGFANVAGFLDALNDSHTFFRPPPRPMRLDYGFRLQMISDKPFITRIRPGTDAEGKVHPGDEVVAYNNFNVSRDQLWKMNYYYNQLSPQASMQLVLRDPDGKQREVKVDAKVQQRKRVLDVTGGGAGVDLWQMIREEENFGHLMRQRYYESGDLMIWKMPEFDMTDDDVDHMFGIAKKHKTLILDLRGNLGGAVDTLARVAGNVFDRDLKIADRAGRKELKPLLAKTRGKNAYSGKIIVLIDSESASAAEIFARVMQLEQRGTVIGDRSSGMVMESQQHGASQGADTIIFYSFSITHADVVMKDGKSLEHSGVLPDEVVLPTGKDLAEGRDPAMVRAAEMAGMKLDPSAAGKLFPYEWQPL